MPKKVNLKFMVVPAQLSKYGYVKNAVKIKITKPYSRTFDGILGNSGRKLAKAGLDFYFEKNIANELIKLKVSKLSHEK